MSDKSVRPHFSLPVASVTLALILPAAAQAATKKVLYMFGSQANDGTSPAASLLNIDGTLYGTTLSGGQTAHGGTVFALTPDGTESVLYPFSEKRNGEAPHGAYLQGSLIEVGGALVGTTTFGGSAGYGTVFRLTLNGKERVIYSFQGGSDGQFPERALLNFGGMLYGTTYGTADGGGSGNCPDGCGTVFSLTPSGVEKLLHVFNGGNDGANPRSALINVGGTFYGTTQNGGAGGNGTVFSITPQGVEHVLYAFTGGSDGGSLTSDLINVGGTLYGTTTNGGAYGNGVVFKMTRKGVETVLYAFGAQTNDGANPRFGLINVNGLFYGTTYNGGSNNDGTVFSMTPQGQETVLYSFTGSPNDGINPNGLIDVGGVLYGTTGGGGCCIGVAFAITP